MGKHTPEPWESHEHMVFQGEHGGFSLRNDRNNAEDARRIVACVNACRGIPTEELEQKGLVVASGDQLLEVEQQRDDIGFQKAKELLAELKKDVELTMRNNQVGKNLLVVGICKEKLSRIDEILNWKEGV